jgi:hypothetical protein
MLAGMGRLDGKMMRHSQAERMENKPYPESEIPSDFQGKGIFMEKQL